MAGAEKQLNQPTREEAVRQISTVERKLTFFVEHMEMLNEHCKLDSFGKERLEAAKDLLLKVLVLKEQLQQIKNADEKFQVSQKEMDSLSTRLKHTLGEAYERGITLFGTINKDLVGSADMMNENQRKSLNMVLQSLNDLSNAILPIISTVDKMTDALIDGNMEEFDSHYHLYKEQVEKAIFCQKDLQLSIECFQRDRDIFEGAMKIATDLAIDAATMIITGGTISALSKVGKIKRIADAARKARIASQVKYTPPAPTAAQKVVYGAAEKVVSTIRSYRSGAVIAEKLITGSVESAFSLASSALKNGEITNADMLACALVIVPLSSRLEIGISTTTKETFEKLYEMTLNGEISFKHLATFVRKNMPEIYKNAEKAATSFDKGKVVKDPTMLYEYIKDYYSEGIVGGVGHGARTGAQKALNLATQAAVRSVKEAMKSSSRDFVPPMTEGNNADDKTK